MASFVPGRSKLVSLTCLCFWSDSWKAESAGDCSLPVWSQGLHGASVAEQSDFLHESSELQETRAEAVSPLTVWVWHWPRNTSSADMNLFGSRRKADEPDLSIVGVSKNLGP